MFFNNYQFLIANQSSILLKWRKIQYYHYILQQIHMNFRLTILLTLCITLTVTQFSSYVEEFSFDNPTQFVTPVPLTQPLDQYIQFKASQSTQAAANAVNSAQDPRQAQAISQATGLGRPRQNIQSNSQQTFALINKQEKLTSIFDFICQFPLKRINGRCQCPPNFKFIFGRCISDGTGDDGDNGDGNAGDNSDTNTGTAECPLLKISRINTNNPIENLALIQRTYDGKNNNQQNADWGSEGAALERRVQANYQDGISIPISSLPGPRVVSNNIGSQRQPIRKSRVNATIAFTIFGQFIDHDIDLTPTQRGNNVERMDIIIPPGDRFFTNQTAIGFSRSQFTQSNGGPRRHPNLVTSWIDGSQVYGSNNVTNCALRTFKNGKLKVSKQGNQDFLPLFNNFFRAGDVRALENMILTTFQTIFLREHNRICDRVLGENSRLNDETVFQIARNYVIGLLQKITLKDFVPILLGDSYNKIVGPYRGYNKNLNPNIPTEFSTASYRLGHTLLINSIPTIDKRGRIVKQFRLNELFFKQDLVNENFIEQIMRGSARTLTKQKSSQLVDDVRNLLVLDPARQVKLDLFSLNIQRGRDHGLPTYNDARSAFGLSRIRTFRQLLPTSQLSVANKLQQVYGQTDKIQLFVGIISQRPLGNAIVGALGAQVVGQTFRNLRDADRFWYEKTFPKEIITEIQRTTLADIIRRNTQAKDIPDDVFRFLG